MTEIKTKWQYLSDRTAEEGFWAASRLADEIDELITLLNLNDNTDKWIAATDDGLEYLDTYEIATSQEFCNVCDTNVSGCDVCPFSRCGGSTLFHAFLKQIKGEVE